MKLGICYMLFDGEEFLEFAAKSIRSVTHHISVTYQDVSYFGNKSDIDLLELLKTLKSKSVIDEFVLYDPDFSIEPKENELRLRNIGLEMSKNSGCTHHISCDVDEFYLPKEIEYAKSVMEDDYDLSIMPYLTYYKDPTFLVQPDLKVSCSFIHPVNNQYCRNDSKFPYVMEETRRLTKFDKVKIFSKDEVTCHHMSYVRKNIRKKFENSSNGAFYNIDKFCKDYEEYQVGGRVCLIPDFKNRKTVKVDNLFNIKF